MRGKFLGEHYYSPLLKEHSFLVQVCIEAVCTMLLLTNTAWYGDMYYLILHSKKNGQMLLISPLYMWKAAGYSLVMMFLTGQELIVNAWNRTLA